MSARGFDIADRLLGMAAKISAEAIVAVRESSAGHVRFAAGEITTAGEVDETETRLTIAFGRRHAKARVNQTDEASLRALFERTVTLAKIAPEDPEYLPSLPPQRYVQNTHAWDEATSVWPATNRARVARAAIARAEEKALIASGFVQNRAESVTFATSTGLRADHRGTIGQATTTVRTADGAGSGWAGAEDARGSAIDGAELARVAAEKAERSHGATKLDPGRYTVVLEPAAAAELLGFLIEALDARSADEGRSFFTGRLGQSIFDPRVTLRSDPLDPSTPGCPWDTDGIPLAPTTWIENGALKTLYNTRFWAQKMGRSPTGSHSSWNLSSNSGLEGDALVRGVQRGLLVTRFWYSRWLDPKALMVTGLTRDGVFLIENGVVTRPVNNFRYNDSPVKMLSKLVAMSARTYRVPWWSGAVRVPIVCCDDFEMSSVSDAV